MKYYLFIDETGDHGLKKIDINFPIFLLSGILIKTTDLNHLELLLKKLKTPQVPKKWNFNVIILVLFVVFFIFFAYNCKYGMFKIEDSEIFYFSS